MSENIVINRTVETSVAVGNVNLHKSPQFIKLTVWCEEGTSSTVYLSTQDLSDLSDVIEALEISEEQNNE